MILHHQTQQNSFKLGIFAILVTSTITTLAFAAERFTIYQPLSLADVQTVVDNSNEDFPLEVNQAILDELNIYVGTDTGRHFVRSALERRKALNEIFAKHLGTRVPIELEAISLIEAGFQNLAPHTSYPHSAGMWQFIPQTARAFGLRVDIDVDERLDLNQSTDAAARLLAALYLQFQDWRLAILAYNAGDQRIQAGIEATHSRNPWDIIQAGFEGDTRYLAKVMAGVLVLKNPEWINRN